MSLEEGFNSDEILYCDFYSLIKANIDKLTYLKNQYMGLMSELTICEELDNDVFFSKIKEINLMGKIIIGYKYINSLENKDQNQKQIEIVGSGTIIIEPKIIRGAKSVGHVEDIVVKKSHRGKKISQSILNKLKEFAQLKNCYKVILDCEESVCVVYKSNGFEAKGVQMGLYF